MTGFYVTNVVSRYWDQFLSLPTTDKLAYRLVASIPGKVKLLLLSLGSYHGRNGADSWLCSAHKFCSVPFCLLGLQT